MAKKARSGSAVAVLVVAVLLFAVARSVGCTALEGLPSRAGRPTGTAPAAVTPAYALYFTRPDGAARAKGGRDGVDARLVERIDLARTNVDIAVYQLDLGTVVGALVRAASRGVRVRVVTDSDALARPGKATARAAEALRAAGIAVVGDGRRELMHHKFAVVDGEWVATGSWNFTEGDTYRLDNNLFVAHSRELAADYEAELEKLLSRSAGRARGKPPGVPYRDVMVGPARVRVLFAPQDGVAAELAGVVRSARRTVRFLAFSFTHDGLGDAMIERARAGIDVAGVMESTGSGTAHSELRRLEEAGIEVLKDGNRWAMHHKVIVVDGAISVFGSFNFSDNADAGNDENALVVRDPVIASAFEAEVARIQEVARRRR